MGEHCALLDTPRPLLGLSAPLYRPPPCSGVSMLVEKIIKVFRGRNVHSRNVLRRNARRLDLPKRPTFPPSCASSFPTFPLLPFFVSSLLKPPPEPPTVFLSLPLMHLRFPSLVPPSLFPYNIPYPSLPFPLPFLPHPITPPPPNLLCPILCCSRSRF